jgi:hypothetical protein
MQDRTSANSTKSSCNARPDHTLGHILSKGGLQEFVLSSDIRELSRIGDILQLDFEDSQFVDEFGRRNLDQNAHRCSNSPQAGIMARFVRRVLR